MFHYNFTNDLRISNLDGILQEAACAFLNNSVPSANEDKSKNNNFMTVGFYFNLKACGSCARLAAAGNTKKVVLNFIKKFQYPNMRTNADYELAIQDGIKLAPMREIVKLLNALYLIDKEQAYLSRDEIKYFIFFNERIAKAEHHNIIETAIQLLDYRRTNVFPENISTNEEEHQWNQPDRQIRETLNCTGCFREHLDKIMLDANVISRDAKADLFEIVNYDSFWNGNTIENWQEYMDENLIVEEGELGINGHEDRAQDHENHVPIQIRPLETEQIIYYGVPGCGKSYEVNKEIDGKLAGLQDKEYHKVRCVFHQEYSNADFVGQVYPFVEPGGHGVDYRFKPGPFAEVVRRAYREPNEPFFLIIEEINRGNAAAIFGEVFQLLDRIKPGDSPDESTENIYQPGWSSYGVSNADVNAYIRQKTVDEEEIRVLRQNHDSLYDEEINIQRDDCAHKVINGNVRTVRERELHFTWTTAIRLPPNISIYATMNTSDQNVSTMDNAFQRRLESKMIRNDLKNEAQYNIKIKGTNVYWGAFRDWVNKKILSTPGISKADDKCLGGWFISTAVEMKDAEGNVTKYEDIKREVFAEKVIKYLWDDVFKRNTAAEIFRKGTGNGEFKSLSELIDAFEKKNDDGSFRYVNLDAFDKVFKLSQEDKANLIKDINGVSAQDNPGNNAIAEGEPGVDA